MPELIGCERGGEVGPAKAEGGEVPEGFERVPEGPLGDGLHGLGELKVGQLLVVVDEARGADGLKSWVYLKRFSI